MKAIVGARLIDGTGAPPVPNAVVIVDGDQIVGVHAAGSDVVPPQAEIIDATDLTLMPGLIDSHDHLAHFGHDLAVRWGIDEPQSLRHARVFDVLKQTLETGFTTVRDAAGLDAGFQRRGGPRAHARPAVAGRPQLHHAHGGAGGPYQPLRTLPRSGSPVRPSPGYRRRPFRHAR